MAQEQHPGTTPVLVVADLTYDYPTRRALDRVGFRVERGAVVALVGPNGAGKTTLMRCIAGLETSFFGRILVDGQDVQETPRAARARIGYLPDHFGLYDALTARQLLLHWAAANRLPRAERRDRAIAAAEEVGLSDRLDVRVAEMSRGQRQRLALARTILARPALLLADEPASGLDPEARSQFAGLVRRLAARGMTIMVSSHILAELQDYSTHMLILEAGRVVEMTALVGGRNAARRVRIRLAAPHPDLAELLGSVDFVTGYEPAEDGAVVLLDGGAAAQAELLRRLVAAGVPVHAFAEESLNLQDAYLRRLHGAREVA